MSPKILIVDDEEQITRALRIRLESEGFEVFVGYDGVSGMKYAVKEQPDLILLDISMPAGNGFSLARKIRDHDLTMDTPLVFMTASKDPKYRESAQSYDPIDFLEKPFEAAMVISVIQQALVHS